VGYKLRVVGYKLRVANDPQPATRNQLLTPTTSARKATNMGKQHNKVEKRRRRKEYLRRKKSAAKSATKR